MSSSSRLSLANIPLESHDGPERCFCHDRYPTFVRGFFAVPLASTETNAAYQDTWPALSLDHVHTTESSLTLHRPHATMTLLPAQCRPFPHSPRETGKPCEDFGELLVHQPFKHPGPTGFSAYIRFSAGLYQHYHHHHQYLDHYWTL